jgi:iron complex outermembrane recepter protein
VYPLLRIRVNILRITLLSAPTCLAASILPGLATAQTALPAEDATLQEIVVTATRRESSLLNVPVAVSAFGGAQLEARQVADIGDLSSLVPNFQFGNSYGEARATIRGIGTNDINGGADPGVAYHLDGVYVGITGPAGNSFFDVSRVEVLRGPQGTLFGQNATGGAINLIPNKPTPQPSGEVSATVGTDPSQYGADAVVNGALNSDGTLSGRLSVHKNYNEGYTKNLAPDGPRWLEDDDSIGLRGQLLYRPDEDFELHTEINYQRANDHGPGYQLLGRGGTSGQPTVAQTLGGLIPPPDTHDVYANLGYARGKFLLGSEDGTFKLGSGTLKVLLSAGRTQSDEDSDADGTAVSLASNEVEYVAHQTYGELVYDIKPLSALDVIVGANAFYQDLNQVFNVPVAVIFGPVPVTVSLGGHLYTSTEAMFAHAQYEATDRVQFFGGLRYTYDRKVYNESNNFVGADSGAPHWDKLTYEGGVSTKLTQSVNAYLKYSTGFKGGGLQLGTLAPPVKPETNSSVEAGLKGLFFEHTLETNIAVFHMSYNDLQLTKVQGFVTGFLNAAKATVEGAELEAIWHPTKAFRTEFTGSLLDAKFDSFESADPSDPVAVPPIQNLAGKRLPNSPPGALSLGAYYTLDSATSGSVTLGARYYWQAREYLTVFNTPDISQAAVGRVDLTANFASRNGLWGASMFAKNLTDRVVRGTAIVESNLLGSPTLVTLEPGRSVGISVKRNF